MRKLSSSLPMGKLHPARVCCLLSVVLVAGLHTSTLRGEMVTAVLLPAGGGSFHTGAGKALDPPATDPFDNWLAQTFLAKVRGNASRVSFTAHESAFQSTTAPLRVDLAAVVGGLPGATLATTYVPIAAFPSAWNEDTLNIHADFSGSNLLLEAETVYAIVFSSDTPNANYRFHGSSGDPYAAGTYFKSQNGSPWSPTTSGDLWFEVTVTPVPEPSTLTLAAIGCLAMAFAVGAGRRTN